MAVIYRLIAELAQDAGLPVMTREDVIAVLRNLLRSGYGNGGGARGCTVSFGQAVAASLYARRHRRESTRADLRSYTARMLGYRTTSQISLREMTAVHCGELLNSVFGHSPHVFRKARVILHSIFRYGMRMGWCSYNPAEAIEELPVREERVRILTTRQINALMRACRQSDSADMVHAVRLMLWCGVRPGEVRRLRWRDIDAREQCVYIEGQNSKTGGARAVPLRGEALMLCAEKHPENELIAPSNWTRRWQRLRRAAGLVRWQQDALRHTFASMHLKHFHDLHRLQEEMGHRDCYLLHTRYLNLRNITGRAAYNFFNR